MTKQRARTKIQVSHNHLSRPFFAKSNHTSNPAQPFFATAYSSSIPAVQRQCNAYAQHDNENILQSNSDSQRQDKQHFAGPPLAIQTKLSVGSPNDRFEHEADAVADRVVTQGAAPKIQRMYSACVEAADRKQELRRQPIEEEEQEEVFQTKANPELQRRPIEDEEEEIAVQAKADSQLQRQTPEEENLEEEEEEPVQLKGNSNHAGFNRAGLEKRLRSSQDSGHPLPSSTLQEMNSAFGHDFGGVRIHTSTQAVQLNRDLSAQAFTHGSNVYFNQGKFAPDSNQGKLLLAHELTHVVQQGFAGPTANDPNLIQRDLAIEARGTGRRRALSQTDIRDAIRYNRRAFSDPYSLMTIRDVIGVPKYPAVSNQTLALGIARWQADHGIAQDGQIGAVTLMLILEELQAEGQTRDATLLRLDFRGRTGRRSRWLPDLNSSHCPCIPNIRSEITDSQSFIPVYQQCGANAAITNGTQVERCVRQHFANQGVTLSTAGTTSGSGATRVARVPGHCGPLIEQVTRAHEQVHSVHTRVLRQRHGRGRAYTRAYNDDQDWVTDEVNARRTDIATARWMLRVLGRLCPVGSGGTP